MSETLKEDPLRIVKSKNNGNTKARRWIPPPALTSKQQLRATKRLNESQLQSAFHSDNSDSENLNFERKLHSLLLDIRKLKSEEFLEKNDENVSKQSEQLIAQRQDIRSLDTINSKATDNVNETLEDEAINHHSLDEIKNELQKKLNENLRLTREKKILMDKFTQVEKNATAAMQHITALRNFIDRLSLSNGVQQQLSAKQSTEKFNKYILTKLDQLDQANHSLHKLIQAIGNNNVPNDISTSHSGSDDNNLLKLDVKKLTGQVKNLLSQIEEDHKQISDLQNIVQKTKLAVLEETKELKKSVKLHKDRAEKCVSSVDSLKLQLLRKNNELSDLKQDINSLRLKITQLTSERDRLEIEKTTLSGKLVAIDSQIKNHNFAVKSQLYIEELSSKLLKASSKRAEFEVENENLKMQLVVAKTEAEELKAELEKQNKDVRDGHSSNSATNTPITNEKNQIGLDQWLQMSELWKQLQNDKLTIIQTLKDLEKKLEKSQESNLEFRRELARKEELMQEINIRLQEKIGENKSLKELLESALTDAKRYSEQIQEMSLNKDNLIHNQMVDLEKQLQEYKKDNAYLRKSNSELEKNFDLQIKTLQERLDLAEKSKKIMHDYVVFLKSSYASVFGEGSLATKNYPF